MQGSEFGERGSCGNLMSLVMTFCLLVCSVSVAKSCSKHGADRASRGEFSQHQQNTHVSAESTCAGCRKDAYVILLSGLLC